MSTAALSAPAFQQQHLATAFRQNHYSSNIQPRHFSNNIQRSSQQKQSSTLTVTAFQHELFGSSAPQRAVFQRLSLNKFFNNTTLTEIFQPKGRRANAEAARRCIPTGLERERTVDHLHMNSHAQTMLRFQANFSCSFSVDSMT